MLDSRIGSMKSLITLLISIFLGSTLCGQKPHWPKTELQQIVDLEHSIVLIPLLDEPELSWSLSAKNHGKGYASEAAILARNWAFREHNIGPLMSLVHPNNISSKRVAERLGASVESHSTWMGQPRLVYRHITLN